MSWLHRLQQRLSITKNEALTLLSLSLFLLVGTAGRFICRQMSPVPDGYYAEIDSLFAARSAAVLSTEPDADRRRPEDLDTTPSPDTILEAGPTAARPIDPPSRKNTIYNDGATELLHIDLNRATLQELDLLPRVGPKTAERIIAFRDAYGPFRSVDELVSVSGIGPKTLELIRPHVHVTDADR